jgi:hypothetical protein
MVPRKSDTFEPVTLVCTKCGIIGADARPDWGRRVNKRQV